MKFVCILILFSWPALVRAQRYDTPAFNFDRSMDASYVDSLLRVTRARLLSLDRLRPSPTVDTARMEFMHFMAYVHYSGMAHRDSALIVTKQLIQLAQRTGNSKYQIKGLLQAERYHRSVRIDYPRAIRLNYTLLDLIETAPQTFAPYYWRVYRNLGTINTSIGEYPEAIQNLHKSIDWFAKDPKSDPIHLADLNQLLGNAYESQRQLGAAQTHYLRAWHIVTTHKASISNKAYLTNEIGRLYNSRQNPEQAVPYLRQSIAYWSQLKAPLPQADALADLAESYLALGRYPEAIAHAQEALAKNQKVAAPMLTAYSVLMRAYEHRQDWKNAFTYQRLYNRKKQEKQQAINQAETLRIKARFDRARLETAHEQERLQLNLLAQKRLQNQLFAGLGIISLLGLLLLYYSLRLRRTNRALRTKNREIEMALIKGQTIERKRVATELHDRVSSLLGATKMTFQTIDAEGLPPRDKQLYESSLNLLNDAATQVRQLSHNLIPEQLLQQDLAVSLRGLVKKLNLTGRTVFSLTNESAETIPLNQEATFNLYIICLELCTNILRHAQAQHAHLRLIHHDGWLVIQLSDDGIGIDQTLEGGMGLHNIRERAENIGAQFRLEADPVQGTKASLVLPL